MAREWIPPAIEPAVLTTPAALAAAEIRDSHDELIDRQRNRNPGVQIAIPSDELPPPARRIILIKPGLNGYIAIESIRSGTRTSALHRATRPESKARNLLLSPTSP